MISVMIVICISSQIHGALVQKGKGCVFLGVLGEVLWSKWRSDVFVQMTKCIFPNPKPYLSCTAWGLDNLGSTGWWRPKRGSNRIYDLRPRQPATLHPLFSRQQKMAGKYSRTKTRSVDAISISNLKLSITIASKKWAENILEIRSALGSSSDAKLWIW